MDRTLFFEQIKFDGRIGNAEFDKDGMTWKMPGLKDALKRIEKDGLKRIDSVSTGNRHQLRFFGAILKNSAELAVDRFSGFKKDNIEKISKFLTEFWNQQIDEYTICPKGGILGDIKLKSKMIEFRNKNEKCFDIFLDQIDQCFSLNNDLVIETSTKNILDNEQMSSIRISLPAKRDLDGFIVDSEENAEKNTKNNSQNDTKNGVQKIEKNTQSAAGLAKLIKSQSGFAFRGDKNSLVKFSEMQFLTPRGRFDVILKKDALCLHGKSFTFNVPFLNIFKMFLVPSFNKGHLLIVYLKKPLNQGKTFYNFLVINFKENDQINVDIDLTEEEIKSKFGDTLQQKMEGDSFKVVTRILKNFANVKVFMPGTFKSDQGNQFVRCAYKAAQGYLYLFEASFLFLTKPVLYIPHTNIASIEFHRIINTTASTRMFDLSISIKPSRLENTSRKKERTFIFMSIAKSEFQSLFRFLANKNINLVNKEILGRTITKRKKGQRSCVNNFPNTLLPDNENESTSDEDFTSGDELKLNDDEENSGDESESTDDKNYDDKNSDDNTSGYENSDDESDEKSDENDSDESGRKSKTKIIDDDE